MPEPLPDIEDLHREACARGAPTYVDPATGLHVFTAAYLRTRPCCGCGCRHCPYRRARARPRARLLAGSLDDLPERADVLFWSGGKDSFLALRRLRARPVVLLTTFDAGSGVVAHQEVEIAQVQRQARVMRLPLLGVPVWHGEYLQCVHAGIDKLRDNGVEVGRLVFGDLHLQHIRAWREAHLHKLGATLAYPLWKVPYEELAAELERAQVVVRLSAVDRCRVGDAVRVGDVFDRKLRARLPEGVDGFGENGEFHTLVEVWNTPTGADRLWGEA